MGNSLTVLSCSVLGIGLGCFSLAAGLDSGLFFVGRIGDGFVIVHELFVCDSAIRCKDDCLHDMLELVGAKERVVTLIVTFRLVCLVNCYFKVFCLHEAILS